MLIVGFGQQAKARRASAALGSAAPRAGAHTRRWRTLRALSTAAGGGNGSNGNGGGGGGGDGGGKKHGTKRERDGGAPHERYRLDLHLRATHAAEHHLQSISLRSCTYEYGSSLLSLYVASVLLAAMGVYIARHYFRGHGIGRHPPSICRARAHLGEGASPRRC